MVIFMKFRENIKNFVERMHPYFCPSGYLLDLLRFDRALFPLPFSRFFFFIKKEFIWALKGNNFFIKVMTVSDPARGQQTTGENLKSFFKKVFQLYSTSRTDLLI